jgi:alkylation response protein AidB-like acyl-CoA dehydrogenase
VTLNVFYAPAPVDLDALGREAEGRAAEIEAGRRLPDDLMAMVVDTGLLRQWVPTCYGGGGADVVTVLDAIEDLATHDGSTAWVAMIGTTTGLCASFLPPEWAETIYGDPRAMTGGYAMPAGTARRVEGGLVVDGHWQWGSGTHHCTWIGGGCRVEDGTMPFVLMPAADVTLLDTWHVAGLKGTGSTDYVARDVFVPEGRWVNFLGGTPVVDEPLSRMPFLGLLALGVCAVTLGLARRAQAELVALAAGKRPSGSARPLAERPVVQASVAQAEAAWRSARALVRETAAAAWMQACAGPLGPEHRRMLRLAAVNATWRAAEAVDRMYHAGGGSSIHEESALQRVFRDVHTATQHGMVAERIYEPLGRIALGLETDVTQL